MVFFKSLCYRPRTGVDGQGGMQSVRNGCVVLVVEDHTDTLRVMAKVLESNGYTVVAAAGYREAVEAFERTECQLLVSDIGLPDGSGLDLIRELAPKGVKGIAVSAYAHDKDIQASLDAGFAAHLCKPLSLTKLFETLDRLALE